MNPLKFDDWKASVIEMKNVSDEIDKTRDEIFKWMADELRIIFEECDIPIKENGVFFSKDGYVIQVFLDENTMNCIPFCKHFIDCIGMPFAVKRRLNSEAENELFVELYPLTEGCIL